MKELGLRTLMIAFPALWASAALAQEEGVDALEAEVVTEDAERFAELFAEDGDALSPAALQTGYLDRGTEAIGVFTEGRIKNAENLAAKIAENRDAYARAIDVCLPAAQAAKPDLRAIYLGYEGLLDDPKLPRTYALIGANNSGGTTGKNEIVLGLEVICRVADGGPDDVRQWLRNFFVHEIAHTQQTFNPEPTLLSQVLTEGGAEFIGQLIAGETLNDKLGEWALPKEREIWEKFQEDISNPDFEGFSPWLYTGQPENGWPMDVGYWLGAQIAARYYENADDKRQAVRDILTAGLNAEAFFEKSGYAEKFAEPR